MELTYYILEGGSRLELKSPSQQVTLPLPPVLESVSYNEELNEFTMPNVGESEEEAADFIAHVVQAMADLYEAVPRLVLFDKDNGRWVEVNPADMILG